MTFVRIIETLSHSEYRTKIIQEVIDRQYLEQSYENYTRLRSLINFVQATLRNFYTVDQYLQITATLDGEMMAALGFSEAKKPKKEYFWTTRQLDLLCKMLEHLQQVVRVDR